MTPQNEWDENYLVMDSLEIKQNVSQEFNLKATKLVFPLKTSYINGKIESMWIWVNETLDKKNKNRNITL